MLDTPPKTKTIFLVSLLSPTGLGDSNLREQYTCSLYWYYKRARQLQQMLWKIAFRMPVSLNKNEPFFNEQIRGSMNVWICSGCLYKIRLIFQWYGFEYLWRLWCYWTNRIFSFCLFGDSIHLDTRPRFFQVGLPFHKGGMKPRAKLILRRSCSYSCASKNWFSSLFTKLILQSHRHMHAFTFPSLSFPLSAFLYPLSIYTKNRLPFDKEVPLHGVL